MRSWSWGSEPGSSKDVIEPWAWQAKYMKPWKAFLPSQNSSLPLPLKKPHNCQVAMQVIMAQALVNAAELRFFSLQASR
jgi:hypothetical protein